MHGPAALPSLPLPPPLHMPPPVDRRDDIPETEMPPCKRLCLSTLGSRYEGYLVDPAKAVPEIAPMTVRERVDLLMEDRIAHQETIQIVEDEAYAARESWAHSIGLKLLETDRRRQEQMAETLRVMKDMRREMGDMQAELLTLPEQSSRVGQSRGDARVHNHQDAPRDANSHI
nr:hypothetical protein [Tanacetum cinerariifolium]